MRRNGVANEIASSPRSTVSPPCTVRARWFMSSSLKRIMSWTSQYAAYSSSIVNSGLCVASMPSLRKMRPIS